MRNIHSLRTNVGVRANKFQRCLKSYLRLDLLPEHEVRPRPDHEIVPSGFFKEMRCRKNYNHLFPGERVNILIRTDRQLENNNH